MSFAKLTNLSSTTRHVQAYNPTSSDYPQFEGLNRAGVLTFHIGATGSDNNDDDVKVFKFKSKEMYSAIGQKNREGNRRLPYDLRGTKRSLYDEIFLRKAAIQSRLIKASMDGKTVTIKQWAGVMKETTGFDLDWNELQPLLSARVKELEIGENIVNKTSMISIEQFLSNFDRSNHKESLGPQVEKTFQQCKLLFKLFRYFNTSNSNSLSFGEFQEGVTALNSNLMPEGRLDEKDTKILFESLDTNKNGVIELDEWNNIANLL